MNLTKTEVANLALSKLGVSHVLVDFDSDPSNPAKILRRQYRTALSSVIEYHEWSFATRYQALALVQEYPAPNWAFAYALPSDAAVVRRVATENLFFHAQEYYYEKEQWMEVETDVGLVIYSNVPLAWAEYTAMVPEAGPYPARFARALACQLALDAAASLITNNFAKVKDMLTKDCRNEMTQQVALDAARQPAPVPSPSPFERARLRQ